MQQTLQQRVVLITGAASGIGRATAVRFAQAGASLALIDRDTKALAPLAEDLRARAITVRTACLDVRDEPAVRVGVDAILAPFGRLDVVFANVGLLSAKGPFERTTLEQWRDAFALNLFAHVATLQTALPYLQGAGGGSVITNCSDQALRPDAGLSVYAATKAALLNLTYTLASEWAPYGIRVNAIAAGMTRTPLVEAPGGLLDQYAQEYDMADRREEAMRFELRRRGVPLSRLAEPEEIAEAVFYLASATFCTAMTLRIDGGNVRSIG